MGGKLDEISERVIENANFTWLYLDPPLLKRLTKAYDLNRQDILIIPSDQLVEWADAVSSLLPTGPASTEHQ